MWTLQAHTYSTTGRQSRMMEGQVAAMSLHQPAPVMQVPLLFVYIARALHFCFTDVLLIYVHNTIVHFVSSQGFYIHSEGSASTGQPEQPNQEVQQAWIVSQTQTTSRCSVRL